MTESFHPWGKFPTDDRLRYEDRLQRREELRAVARGLGWRLRDREQLHLQESIPHRRRDPPWPTFRIWYLGAPFQTPFVCSRVRTIGVTCLGCLLRGSYFTLPTKWSEDKIKEQYDMANAAIEALAKERGISIFTAYDLVAKDPTLVPPGAIKQYVPRNQTKAVTLALLKLGETRLDDLYDELKRDRDLGLDKHHLVHVLHSLRRRGLISFSQHSGGQSGQDLRNIKLRDNKTVDRVVAVSTSAVPKRRTKVKSPIGKDMTDYRQHQKVAVGGEIEHIKPRPPEQNEKPVPQIVPVATPAPVKAELNGSYPLIEELAQRRTKVEAAAKLLEEVGQADLALSALEKIEYTAFEKEVLRLWEAVK